MVLDCLLLIVLGGAVVALLGFVGCDSDLVAKGSQGPLHPYTEFASVVLELTYDPKVLIGGKVVGIERVDFVIHREGGSTTLENTESLLPDHAQLDFMGWGTQSDNGV